LAVLRHLFQLAIRRWQLLDRNPVFAVDWPKAPPYNARIPTRIERQRLLAAAEPFFRPFILVGMYTGLRKGSILRLEAENYLNEPRILRVIQKGGRELKLPMTPPLKKVLDGVGIAAGPLFHWPDGRVVHRFPRKAWARACLKAGLYVEKPDARNPKKTRKVPAIRFHDLRHCMGTVLAEAGVEQRLIQELLGHSGIRISERYTKPRRPALRRAALKATRLMGVEPPPSSCTEDS
jgi:integrase